MPMSRRDFADLAASLRTAHSEVPTRDLNAAYAHRILDELAENIADLCAKGNERFDRARFLGACQAGDVHAPTSRRVA